MLAGIEEVCLFPLVQPVSVRKDKLTVQVPQTPLEIGVLGEAPREPRANLGVSERLCRKLLRLL